MNSAGILKFIPDNVVERAISEIEWQLLDQSCKLATLHFHVVHILDVPLKAVNILYFFHIFHNLARRRASVETEHALW